MLIDNIMKKILVAIDGSEGSNKVADYAKNNQVDLIIVGIRKRSFFARFFFGDAKANVYNQVSCPVLVVK